MTDPRRRLAKLLALAGSSNPHEAAAAREEARRLVRERGIGLLLAAARASSLRRLGSREGNRDLLARALCDAHCCRPAIGRWIEIIGARDDVNRVARMYDDILRRAIALAESLYPPASAPDFATGYVDGLVDAYYATAPPPPGTAPNDPDAGAAPATADEGRDDPRSLEAYAAGLDAGARCGIRRRGRGTERAPEARPERLLPCPAGR